MSQPRALITGITGQDGSYLAELLLAKEYKVFGLVRRSSAGDTNLGRIEHLLDRITLISGDLTDSSSLVRAIKEAQPSEIYNLAAQSYVQDSFQQPLLTSEVTGLGATRLLEAVRENAPETRYYQASSSEMFGNAPHAPQDELTPLVPRSPYGVAKLYAHMMTRNYREAYGLFACSGILFNHESPRRTLHFVTRKITDGVARIATGKADRLDLGNLEATRDWGFAGDYVEAMWLMLQSETPSDYVVATGESHSVREFCEAAFAAVDLDYRDYVQSTEANMRPAELHDLKGNAARARAELGWSPNVSFSGLVAMMVEADLQRHRRS